MDDRAPAELIERLAGSFGTRTVATFSETDLPGALESRSSAATLEADTAAIAYESGDCLVEALARNYANARGLPLIDIEPPTAEERGAVESAVATLRLRADRADQVLSSIPGRSLSAAPTRLTIVCDEIFPYHLLYRNVPVGVLPKGLAWRVMLEEVVLSLYQRPSVLGVAVDATDVPGSAPLVSEIPDLIPDLEKHGMRFMVLPQGTNADLFSVVLNQFPFDVMIVAAHSAPVLRRTCRYTFAGATGFHSVDVEEEAATAQTRTKFLAVDDLPLHEVSEPIRDDMREAFEEKAFKLLSSRDLPWTGDEALQLPSGDTHLGGCRIGLGRTLPVILGNFCGSNAFGRNALSGGAGGFGGTLWPVGDGSARAVAREFVRQACNGKTFAEALFESRKETSDTRSASAYEFIGSAEHGLELTGVDPVMALRHMVNKLYEVASSYARYAPLDKLPDEFKAGLALVLPRLNDAMKQLAAADEGQTSFVLMLRADLCSYMVQTGTPAALFESDLEQVERQARSRMAEHGFDRLLSKALVSIGVVAAMRGSVTQGLQLIDEAIADLESLDDEDSALAGALTTKANCLFIASRLEEADEAYARAQRMLEKQGIASDVAVLLARRTACALRMEGADSLDEKLDSVDRDLDDIESMATESGDTDALATVIETRGFVARHRKDYEAAAEQGRRLIELSDDQRSDRILIPSLYNLASDLGKLGRFEEAEERASAAIQLARTAGDERELMMALNNRAVLRLANDDERAWDDVDELRTMNWQEHPYIAVRIRFWDAWRARDAGETRAEKTALAQLLAGDGLPPGLEYAGTLGFLELCAHERKFPAADDLLHMTDRLLDAALRAGTVDEILPLVDRYLQMKVDDADVHTALVVRLAKSRIRGQDEDPRAFANARLVAGIQEMNDGNPKDGIELLEGAYELFSGLGEHLLAFICAVLAGRLHVWWSKNGGDVESWIAGLSLFAQARGLWSANHEAMVGDHENPWQALLPELLETLCLGLTIALDADGAIGARSAALATTSETEGALIEDRLPSEDEIRQGVADLAERLEELSR